MPQTSTEIAELWRAVSREFHDRFRQAFRGSDLPLGTLLLLRGIGLHPGVTVSELSRHSGMVKSQVSKMVELLSNQGLVEKQADPADQRLVRVYSSQSAAQCMPQMEARMQSAWSAVLAEIPEGQAAQVADGLRILLTALESANAKVDKDG